MKSPSFGATDLTCMRDGPPTARKKTLAPLDQPGEWSPGLVLFVPSALIFFGRQRPKPGAAKGANGHRCDDLPVSRPPPGKARGVLSQPATCAPHQSHTKRWPNKMTEQMAEQMTHSLLQPGRPTGAGRRRARQWVAGLCLLACAWGPWPLGAQGLAESAGVVVAPLPWAPGATAAATPLAPASLHAMGVSSVGFVGAPIELNFQDIELRAFFSVLADFAGVNVVTSDAVKGSLSLRLKDVPWDQALDIVLKAKDLGLRREGNVLWIAPKAEMTARDKAELEQRAALIALEPLLNRRFALNYAKAADVLAHIQARGAEGKSAPSAGILSARGSALAEVRTNQLFVTDLAERLQRVQTLIEQLDIPIRQVLIEARIVEADERFGRSIGVRLGGSDLGGLRGGQAGYGLGGNNRLAWGGSYDAITATTAESQVRLNSLNTAFVNLPAIGLGGYAPSALAVSLFSPLANRFINLELSALQADGRGKIVASPRVVTANQVKALIEQGTEFPYQTATTSGATAVAFRKAHLKLEVTPQITPEGGIILSVDVNKDSRGETTAAGIAINTKHVKTQVLVADGGTVVIGGIYEETETQDETKVPWLGDLPGVGHLFKSRTRSVYKSEMLVFITPRLLEPLLQGR